MKKIIIFITILVVVVVGYKLYQMKKVDQLMQDAGYSGSLKSGQYVKRESGKDDIESYISLGSFFDNNDYVFSFHYFTEEQQISFFQTIDNSKTEEFLFSYNDGDTCPIKVSEDGSVKVDNLSYNYQISCEDADTTSELFITGFELYTSEKEQLNM